MSSQTKSSPGLRANDRQPATKTTSKPTINHHTQSRLCKEARTPSKDEKQQMGAAAIRRSQAILQPPRSPNLAPRHTMNPPFGSARKLGRTGICWPRQYMPSRERTA